MQANRKIAQLLELFDQLPLEDRSSLIDILRQRLVEKRRAELIQTV